MKIPEYDCVVRAALAEGWFAEMVEANTTPCTPAEAKAILASYLPGVPATFRKGSRGRATIRAGRARITLPSNPGHKCRSLHPGLVLHEAAHIKAIWTYGLDGRGHGTNFCRVYRAALKAVAWRNKVATSSYREIYDRHRGPYALCILKTVAKGKGTTPVNETIEGPFSAEDAHEEARLLLKRDETIDEIFIYSNTEGQFIGAFYKRDQVHAAWWDLEASSGRLELPVEQPAAAALLPEQPEPVPAVVDPSEFSLQVESVSEPRPVRDVPPQEPPAQRPVKPAKKSGERFPAVRGRAVTIATVEGWPKAASAQYVREWWIARGGVPATVPEVVAEIGPKLVEMGVGFPAAMMSRLKQAGLLKETEK